MGSTRAPLRLAILEADTPLPNTNAKYHGYGGVFTDLFRRAVAPDPVEAHLAIEAYDVVGRPDRYPDLAAVDAVLISGSKHSAYLDEPWILALVDFARRALAETEGRVRVVGVCFGHQVVGRALGVPVGVNAKGWEVSVTEMRLTGKGKEVFGSDTLVSGNPVTYFGNLESDPIVPLTFVPASPEKKKIHQMHRDYVQGTPEGAVPLAETDVCAMQGFLLPGRAITVQGHPEFTGEIVTEILGLRVENKIISEDLYKSGMDRVKDEHDGVRIAQTFLKFMRGELD